MLVSSAKRTKFKFWEDRTMSLMYRMNNIFIITLGYCSSLHNFVMFKAICKWDLLLLNIYLLWLNILS